jgi:hypothetical protein
MAASLPDDGLDNTLRLYKALDESVSGIRFPFPIPDRD